MAGADPLLIVEDLRVRFRGGTEAVRGIGFALRAGECLAIVGESGSGKSVTARTLVGLAGPGSAVRAARLELDGLDLLRLSPARWRSLRGGRIGLVLQDALTSLDPLRTVGDEIVEPLRNHRVVPRERHRARAVELLRQVHVPDPERRATQYPHQLSGGQRQRALIASAIAAEPDVLIADEPTTALDVTVQAQILDLLAEKLEAGTALLLISHDLAVVARLADRIAVMYQGVFVEEGPAAKVLFSPAHPYTRALLAAVPAPHRRGERLAPHPVSSAAVPTAGCPYAPLCPIAEDRCRTETPARATVAGDPAGEHAVWCLRTGAAWPRPAATARSAGSARPEATRVLEVERVGKRYGDHPAVSEVSLTLDAGEILGVVGESGSGKTTLAHLVLGLIEPDQGTVRVLGRPWSGRPESERRPLRRRIQLVQQDPLASFDPRYTVERIIGEALGGRRRGARKRARIRELLDQVGLSPALLDRRPRQLSGGQRQRVAIARALAGEPSILVCDEPVSALDVSIQAQILDLFADLRDRLGVALLFISHDLGVVHHLSDRVLVMRAGRVVESGDVEDVFRHPREPYTRALLAALPRPEDALTAATETRGD